MLFGPIGQRLGDRLGGGLDAVHQGRARIGHGLFDGGFHVLHGLGDGLPAVGGDLGHGLDRLLHAVDELLAGLCDGLDLLGRAVRHHLSGGLHGAGHAVLDGLGGVRHRCHHGLGCVLDQLVVLGQALCKAPADVQADLGEHLGRGVDAEQVLNSSDHAGDQRFDAGEKPRPRILDSVQQARDDVLANMTEFGHIAVPDAQKLCHARKCSFAQIFDAAENAVYQSCQQSSPAFQEVGQVREQGGGELGDQLGRRRDEGGQVVGDADDELLQQFQSCVKNCILMVGQILHQLGDGLGRRRCQPRDGPDNTCCQVFQNAAGCVQHGFGAALRQGCGQSADAVGAPLSCLAQIVVQRIKQLNAEVACSSLQTFHVVLESPCHGFVGSFGRTGAVYHLCEDAVELVSTAGCQRQSAGARFHAGPQACKGRAVSVYAVVKNLQHIAQTLAIGIQLSKTLAGLLLQNFADGRTGVAQLIEHGLGISGSFRCGDTVGRHDSQTAGQIFNADPVGRSQRDDTAHA